MQVSHRLAEISKSSTTYILSRLQEIPNDETSSFGLVQILVKQSTPEKPVPAFITLSIGGHSSVSRVANGSDWNEWQQLLVSAKGPSTAVFQIWSQQGRLEGKCSLPLVQVLDSCSGCTQELCLGVYDAVYWSKEIAKLHVSIKAVSIKDLQESMFWQQLVTFMCLENAGTLNRTEFASLMQQFRSIATQAQLDQMFLDGVSSVPGSSPYLSSAGLKEVIIKHWDLVMRACPVDGAILHPTDKLLNMIYIYMQLTAGNPAARLQPGFKTAAQAVCWRLEQSRHKQLHSSCFGCCGLSSNRKAANSGQHTDGSSATVAHVSPAPMIQSLSYKLGLRVGDNATCILVYNRQLQVLEEERIQPQLLRAMRLLYQTPLGRAALKLGGAAFVKRMSFRKGQRMDQPTSCSDIHTFLETFHGVINLSEMAVPDLKSFRTFNEFFFRQLKHDARPVAAQDDPTILVSCADCRLTVYPSISAATLAWVKGSCFSVDSMLKDAAYARQFQGGAMLIFRLAPQDYHRFHSPLQGVVEGITDISGQYYTVNPVAVNEANCNVFTDNRRALLKIQSQAFGPVAFVAVGATLVGSIRWRVKAGSLLAKGTELGHFAYGGSTIVCFFRRGAVALDEDLRAHSHHSLETLVRVGEAVGRAGSLE